MAQSYIGFDFFQFSGIFFRPFKGVPLLPADPAVEVAFKKRDPMICLL
jgi:hypothetical protein